MQMVTLCTDELPLNAREDAWHSFICDQIHNVSVVNLSSRRFAARIVARQYGEASCAAFWSRPHEVSCKREHLSETGYSGYLVSWQLSGEARIQQDENRFVLHPYELAIVDGRREMSVSFPHDVERIVAKFPAHLLESRIPALRRSHTLRLEPSGPFTGMLLNYLTELAQGEFEFNTSESELLVENACNLLALTVGRSSIADCTDRDIQRNAVMHYIRDNVCDPSLSLDKVSAKLNLSRRLVQKLLSEAETSYTELLLPERLTLAAKQIRQPGSKSIADIAYRCGFNDISNFNRAFKKRYGLSPLAFRNTHRQAG